MEAGKEDEQEQVQQGNEEPPEAGKDDDEEQVQQGNEEPPAIVSEIVQETPAASSATTQKSNSVVVSQEDELNQGKSTTRSLLSILALAASTPSVENPIESAPKQGVESVIPQSASSQMKAPPPG